MIVYLIGFSGSGKSFLGPQLAKHLKLDFYDLDAVIVGNYKETITGIFENMGEHIFREWEAETLRKIDKPDNYVIATGGGTPCYRNNMEYMNRSGLTVFLNPNTDFILGNLKGNTANRPLLKGWKEDELEFWVNTMIEKRLPYYKLSAIEVNPENQPVQDMANRIKEKYNHSR